MCSRAMLLTDQRRPWRQNALLDLAGNAASETDKGAMPGRDDEDQLPVRYACSACRIQAAGARIGAWRDPLGWDSPGAR